MKYELTKEYLTGIEMIDTEHSKLFELANECYDLVMDEDAVDRFDHIVALIEELRTYAATHFAHEEEYMERIQYERRFSERYQHLRFIQKLSEINLDDIDENQQEYLLKLLDFLAQWLYGHIKGMDCRIPREEDIAAQRAAAAARTAESAATQEEQQTEPPVTERGAEPPAAATEKTATEESSASAAPEPAAEAPAEDVDTPASEEPAATEPEHESPAAKKKAAKPKKETTAKEKKTKKK